MGRPESHQGGKHRLPVEKFSRRFATVEQPDQCESDRRVDIVVGKHRAIKIQFRRDPFQEQRSFLGRQRGASDHHALQLSVGKRYWGCPTSAMRRCVRLLSRLFSLRAARSGVLSGRITFEVAPDCAQWGTEIAGKVKAWVKALTGPTSVPGKYLQVPFRRRCSPQRTR